MPLPGEVDWSSATKYRVQVVWRRRWRGGYKARVGWRSWVLKLNNFPDEPAYSLFINGRHILDTSDWPPEWTKRR